MTKKCQYFNCKRDAIGDYGFPYGWRCKEHKIISVTRFGHEEVKPCTALT
jgi:hypothetical protein